MISLTGNLSVHEISGRNGVFRVGKLISDLGEFAIKSRLIEEFDAGTYHGLFSISRIFPSSYASGGRITCEVRAELIDMELDIIDQAPPQRDTVVEPDPLDEERLQHKEASAIDSTETALSGAGMELLPTGSTAEDSAQIDDIGKQLFGALWPLGDAVKLDPTVGRYTLRKQIDHLKSKGYRYSPREQQWFPSA
jgi:hypothetical protein